MSDVQIKAGAEICDWTNCPNEAVIAYGEFNVKPKGHHSVVNVGRVALCKSHHREAKRTGGITLDWERILLAQVKGR